jgi:hypothetical protein
MRDPFAREEKVAIKSAPMPATSAVLALLAEIVAAVLAQSAQSAELVAEIRALRADLATRLTPPGQCNDTALAELVAVIEAQIGDRVFYVGDLLIHAQLPLAAPLQAAIVRAAGAMNARRLGKALARAEGLNLNGLTVVRCDSDSSAGIVWQVRKV